VWTARFVALGARTSDGGLIGLPTLKDLVRQFPGTPVCMHWEGRDLDHPYVDGRITAGLDPASIVGTVLGARLLSDGVFGVLAINQASLDHYFREAEREGRLLETFGLSVRGRAELVPRPEDEPLLCFTDLIALDVVTWPGGGGCLLQSDVAEAAGLECPVPPKLTPRPPPASRPTPRSAREHRGAERVRSERTGPLVTEFRVIPPGGDY